MNGTSSAPTGKGLHLVAIGVTTGLARTADRLAHSLESVTGLFRDVFGYRVVPGFGINPNTQDVLTGLRDFAHKRSPDDTVVVYHTGHADIVDGEHRLWMGDTEDPRSTSLRTSELVSLLLADTPLRRLMVIIDACFAGTGGAEALVAGMRAGRRDDKTLVVITAAHPLEQVRAGDFAALFAEAVHHPSTAGHEPPYLDPRGLVQHIHDNKRRPAWQTVSESTLFNTDRVPSFLPNPRYDTRFHDLDLRTQLQLEQGKLREEDLREHFLPRARGVISPVESDWRFEGRDNAMRALSDWLAGRGPDRPEGSVVVVTGDMGSGKSAVLGRLTVLSDTLRRGSVPLQDFDPATVPPPNSVTAAVHARLLTTGQVLDALCAAAGVVAETLGAFLSQAGNRDLCVVIDALDEAMDPRGLVRELLRPLIDVASRTRLRLLLGCRRHVLDGLGDRFTLIDLDDETYADRDSVVRYARRCLTATGDDSPYHQASLVLTDGVAEAIGEAAGNSFLVALITSTSLALRSDLPDPADTAWRAGLPRTAADAMRDDLEFRLGDEAQRALDLLVPLAFSQGAGLPWENVWAGAASQLSGRVHTDEDIVWLREYAGCYVVEAMSQERSVYRLYHAAMAEYVREGHNPVTIHDGFVTYLTGQVPGKKYLVWGRANPYTRRHLATHARLAGRLDGLVTDPGYLVAAERGELVAALPTVKSEAARQAARAYQRAVHRMNGAPDAVGYLQLAAHRVGSMELAELISVRFPERDWGVRWSDMAEESPHRVVARLSEPVTYAYALPSASQEPDLLLVAFGSSLALIDPETGVFKASWQTDGPVIVGLQVLERPDGAVAVVLDSRARLTVLKASTLLVEHHHVLWRWRVIPPYWIGVLFGRFAGAPVPKRNAVRAYATQLDLRARPLVITMAKRRVDAWDLTEGTHVYAAWVGAEQAGVDTMLRIADGHPPHGSLEEATGEFEDRRSLRLTVQGGRVYSVTWQGPRLKVERRFVQGEGGDIGYFYGHQDLIIRAIPINIGGGRVGLVSYAVDGTIRIWDLNSFDDIDGVFRESLSESDVWNLWRGWMGNPTMSDDGQTIVLPLVGELRFLNALTGPGKYSIRAAIPGLRGLPEEEKPIVPTALVSAVVKEKELNSSVLLSFSHHHYGGEWDVWDVNSGKYLGRSPGTDTFVDQAAATEPDRKGTYVVTSGHGDHALVWLLTTRYRPRRIPGPEPLVALVPHRRLKRFGRSRISAVAVGRTAWGRPLALTGDANGKVRVWSLPGGWYLSGLHIRSWFRMALPGRWNTEGVRRLDFVRTENGIPLVIVLRESGRIDVLHLWRGTLLGRQGGENHQSCWMAVRWCSGGVVIATTDTEGRIRCWRLEPDRFTRKGRFLFDLLLRIDLEVVPNGLCFIDDNTLAVTTQTGTVTLELFR